MLKFITQLHVCPRCGGGGLEWTRPECPYCRHRLTFSDRVGWLPEGVQGAFVCVVTMSAALGWQMVLEWADLF